MRSCYGCGSNAPGPKWVLEFPSRAYGIYTKDQGFGPLGSRSRAWNGPPHRVQGQVQKHKKETSFRSVGCWLEPTASNRLLSGANHRVLLALAKLVVRRFGVSGQPPTSSGANGRPKSSFSDLGILFLASHLGYNLSMFLWFCNTLPSPHFNITSSITSNLGIGIS